MELAKNYVSNLDEIYKAEAKASVLDSDGIAKEGKNANEICIPKISMNGLGDYSRNGGYVTNSVNVEYETVQFDYDRGTKIQVDAMDDEETRNVAFGMAGAELERTKVIPEADAYTFAKIAGKTGISGTTGKLSTGADVLSALITAVTAMDEDEVPEEQRFLFITPTLLNLVMGLDTTKSREVLDKFAKIVKVPQTRFYTAIDLLDGTSEDEEAGGYAKASAGKDINFMICHKPAVIKYDKHKVSNIILAKDNQSADADMLKFRKYGVVDVYANKVAGIYCHHKA